MMLLRFCGWADRDVLAQMMLYYERTCTRPRQLFSVGHNCKGNARVCRCVCVCVCVCMCACVSVCAMQTNPEMLQKSWDHSPRPVHCSRSPVHLRAFLINRFEKFKPSCRFGLVFAFERGHEHACSHAACMQIACARGACPQAFACRTLPGALASTIAQRPTCGQCAYQDKACGRGVEDGRLGHPSRKRQDSVHGNKQPNCKRWPPPQSILARARQKVERGRTRQGKGARIGRAPRPRRGGAAMGTRDGAPATIAPAAPFAGHDHCSNGILAMCCAGCRHLDTVPALLPRASKAGTLRLGPGSPRCLLVNF